MKRLFTLAFMALGILAHQTTYSCESTASSNSPVCSGSSVNLTSSGGVSYSWSGPNNYTSSQQNPSFTATSQAAGVYTVTVTDVNGCTSQSSATVVVNPSPQTNIVGPTNIDPQVQYNYVVPYNAGSTYQWSVNGGGVIDNGQSTNSVTLSFPSNGSATLLVTETNGGCYATATKGINIGPTGIDDVKNRIFNIYPNPTNNWIYIELKEPSQLVISDILGQTVMEIGSRTSGQVDVSPLAPGVYILHDLDNISAVRFVKR